MNMLNKPNLIEASGAKESLGLEIESSFLLLMSSLEELILNTRNTKPFAKFTKCLSVILKGLHFVKIEDYLCVPCVKFKNLKVWGPIKTFILT